MNFINGLEFIQEFSKYAEKYVCELEIYHEPREYFHPERNSHHTVYNYEIKPKLFYLANMYLNLTDLERFVKFKISFCNHLNCEAEDGKIIKYFDLTGYYKEDLAVQIIERYWDRYQWNYRKNLAKKLYHPSRLTFDI